MTARLGAALTALAVAAAGCGGGSGGSGERAETAASAQTVRHGVGFRGESHPDPAQEGRSVVSTIYYPAEVEGPDAVEGAAPATGRGPFPLVLFSHGGGTTGRSYSNLLSRVAAAGYVIAAPNYRGPSDDARSRPADARLVISTVLAATAEPSHPLRGLVDGQRIGAMGHSAGGGITLGFAFNSCCLDDRIDAAVLLASARPTYPGDAFPAPGVPALVVHGDADSRAPYAEGAGCSRSCAHRSTS